MPGSVIRKFRESKRLTQEYVAGRMGISQNAYSKIENNITQLTVNHLKKLSDILEVPISDLMKDEFELHKPINIQTEGVSKESLLMMVDNIKEKLQSRRSDRHEHYPVIMALYQTIDEIVNNIE
ncbi:MAG: helix-turn-helix transcriptional regulator [Sphingobacteriales bacterium]|nr:helix-turn-helix transcriptional regulator [Sphingobacteriales bacterium]